MTTNSINLNPNFTKSRLKFNLIHPKNRQDYKTLKIAKNIERERETDKIFEEEKSDEEEKKEEDLKLSKSDEIEDNILRTSHY